MLVLSREEQQQIRIGDNIVITVVRISYDQMTRQRKVRIGIDAPNDVEITRPDAKTGKK